MSNSDAEMRERIGEAIPQAPLFSKEDLRRYAERYYESLESELKDQPWNRDLKDRSEEEVNNFLAWLFDVVKPLNDVAETVEEQAHHALIEHDFFGDETEKLTEVTQGQLDKAKWSIGECLCSSFQRVVNCPVHGRAAR